MISQLFSQDEMDLIDYVITIDTVDGEVNIFTDVNDDRFDNSEVVFTGDVIEANRKR